MFGTNSKVAASGELQAKKQDQSAKNDLSGVDSDYEGSNPVEKSEQFAMRDLSEFEKLERNEIIQYVAKLHKVLHIKEKILKKYEEKVRKLFLEIEELKKSRQLSKAESKNETTSSECLNSTTAVSLVDEIREAAEQAQHLSGFVYEPTSGLYYDQKTGYYYNAEYGLYYDGNTGCYYNYDQDKNVFEFHSQVEVQPNQAAAKDTNVKDKGDDGNEPDEFDSEVQFDEHGGVITDKQRLRILRKQKRKHEREVEKAKKRKKKSKKKLKSRSKSKLKDSKKASSKSSKKRRKSRHHADDESSDEKKKAENSSFKCDIEDGELSDSSTSTSDTSTTNNSSDDENKDDEENNVPMFKAAGRFQDIAKKYPPSLRIIVQETTTDGLKVGSLSIITFKGGRLGREGNHDVIIPDIKVSKCHLEFSYDKTKCVYKCIDLGSQNGTILNGERMSAPKVISEPFDLVHGSVIQIGQTKLLCHTHEGNSTCGLCEPGLLIEAHSEKDTIGLPTVHLTHKEQLKRLQKKYGLENEKFFENNQTMTDGNYNDRAATRRIKVGSSTDKEKTQSASVSTAISSENKGFKMLSKLGWSEGEALGKSQVESGLLEPINVLSHEGKKGLGCDDAPLPQLSNVEKRKIAASRKMQERYQKSKDIFNISDDSN